MDSKLLFILELALMLLASHTAGYLANKMKQPAVLGQIIAGLLLGLLHLKLSPTIENFAQIGVVMLMFIAGLETDVDELRRSVKSSSFIAIAGVVAPLGLVFLTMFVFMRHHGIVAPLFLAIVTTATSVSISVQTLRDINHLRTRQGVMILGAAIIDDVIGIILLTLLVGVVKPGASSVFTVLGSVCLLFVVIIVFGYLFLKLVRWAEKKCDVEDKLIWISFVLCLLFAFMAEELGVAAITGAYFAGVIFSMTQYRHRISHEMSSISGLIFTPIFFISIGLSINLGAAMGAIAIGSILIIMGCLGKLLGCGLGAKLSGFNSRQATQIGIGMMPRAEVAIITANLGVQMQILTDEHMAATVLMVLVTTLVTPMLLKWSFAREPVHGQ